MSTPAFLLMLAITMPQEPVGPPVLQEAVSVERVMVDARVLHRGRAVSGLRPENFRVRIDGDPAELVSVTWISAKGAEPRPAVAESPQDPASQEAL